MLSNSKFYSLLLATVALQAVIFSVAHSQTASQSTSEGTESIATAKEQAETEFWFGWLETPKQHLRTVLRIERSPSGGKKGGFVVSPDQQPDSLPLTNFQMDANGEWQFTVENPVTPNKAAKFTGKQSSLQVAGELEQNGLKLPLSLQKIESMPSETTQNLGADEVWLGHSTLWFERWIFASVYICVLPTRPRKNRVCSLTR